MNAKAWLRNKKTIFEIDQKHGGIAGSLCGLGYIKPHEKRSDGTITKYKITTTGKLWVGQTPLRQKD